MLQVHSDSGLFVWVFFNGKKTNTGVSQCLALSSDKKKGLGLNLPADFTPYMWSLHVFPRACLGFLGTL